MYVKRLRPSLSRSFPSPWDNHKAKRVKVLMSTPGERVDTTTQATVSRTVHGQNKVMSWLLLTAAGKHKSEVVRAQAKELLGKVSGK